MGSPQIENHTEPDTPGGKQAGSQVLIGFCGVVLVLFAVMLNNPEQVAEWGSKLFGWKRPTGMTPKAECIRNLKVMDGAAQQWALENKKVATDTYALTARDYLDYLPHSTLPICPLAGKYTAGTNVADSPRCSVPGHTL